MNTRKIILYSLFAPLSILIFIILRQLLRGYGLGDWIEIVAIFFVLWIVGIFISLNLSLISHHPRKKQFLFMAGQFAVLLALVVFGIVEHFVNAEPKESNSEQNRRFIEGITTPTTQQLKAFEKLESNFKSPDDFYINTTYSEPKDTLIGKDTSTVYYFYYKYELSNSKIYFSKVRVFMDSANIEVFNGDPKEIPYKDEPY